MTNRIVLLIQTKFCNLLKKWLKIRITAQKYFFILSLLLTLLILSSNSKPQIVKRDFIEIAYNQKVNGFDVSVIWKPKTIQYNYVH